MTQQESTKIPEIMPTEEVITRMTEHEIIAILQKDAISQKEDLLTITYSIKVGPTCVSATYVYTSAPLLFQKYENGIWIIYH